MNYRTFSVVLAATVLLLGANLSFAVENKADAVQGAASAVKAIPKAAKSGKATKHKAVAPIKLVDINSAKKQELMKLQGISATQADKIIASRPFGSKAWLVSKNIVTADIYQVIKDKIVCTITKQDYEKIMADAKANKKK